MSGNGKTVVILPAQAQLATCEADPSLAILATSFVLITLADPATTRTMESVFAVARAKSAVAFLLLVAGNGNSSIKEQTGPWTNLSPLPLTSVAESK